MSDPSGTGGTGATGGTGVPPAPVYADDIKRIKKKENLRKQVINTVVRFLDNVLTKPELWSSSDFKPIRDRCYRITSDPVKYPPPLQMCSKTASNPSDDTCLTLGFAKLIYEADLIKVCDAFPPPLVQVQEVSSRFKSHFCNQVGKDEMVNQVTASVVDGDGIVLTLKIASQMMGFVGLLAEGVVLKLMQFRTLSFRYRTEDPVTQKILLVTHFTVVCSPGRLLVEKVSRYVLEKKVEGSNRVSAGCSSGPDPAGEIAKLEGVGVSDDLTCNGEFCTRYGVRFNRCLREVYPVREHRMDELVANNHWCGKVADFLTNKEKRFVLYCWYAINIYHTCGLGNR